MKKTIKLGITLMIVTAIASLAMAITNSYTSQRIVEQEKIMLSNSLKKVIYGDSFEKKEDYFLAYKNRELIGRVIKISTIGYSSNISALVGIDNENKITGIDVISQQETPGLGIKIKDEEFLKQFIGKESKQIKLKKDYSDGEIDAITGATISSRALTDGIRNAIEKMDT